MSIKDILGPKYRWRIIIGVMGLTTQQFTGINAVFFFSNKIFLLATQNNVLISTILTNFVGAIVVGMGFLIGKVVNMYGRRSIMIFGCVSSIVCMTLIGYFSGDLEKDPTDSESAVITIVVIYIFLALFAVSLGPVPWMVNAEILPPKGCAICTFFCWLAGYLVGQTFPLFLEQFGSAVAFYMFVVLTILNLIFIFKYFPETSGLTKEQIDKYFDDIDQSTTKKGSKQQPLIDIKIINDKQQNQQSQQ